MPLIRPAGTRPHGAGIARAGAADGAAPIPPAGKRHHGAGIAGAGAGDAAGDAAAPIPPAGKRHHGAGIAPAGAGDATGNAATPIPPAGKRHHGADIARAGGGDAAASIPPPGTRPHSPGPKDPPPGTGIFGVADPALAEAVRTYVKLLRATRAVVARLEPRLAESGLTTTQLGVLEVILHQGPTSQRDLGRKVLTSAGNMTDVVDKLAHRGLVRRQRDADDKRSVRVELTPLGRDLIETVFPAHAADIGRAMAALNAAELHQLAALLRKLGHGAAASGEPPPPAAGRTDQRTTAQP